MKKIISYFIKYDVAVNVIVLAFAIFGIIGARSIKSSFFPLVDAKNIQVIITYPGASPQEVEEGVILKIEENLKGLEGVDRVTSTSKENSGTINVEIITGEDIDFMLLDVKNAIDRVSSFPVGMEPLVVYILEEVRETISFSISGSNVPLRTLKQIGQRVENDLRALDGISQISISGYPDEEIEIAVDENKLRAFNLSFTDVSQAVSNANILVTGGTIKTNAEEYLIRANNRSYYGNELANLVVSANNNGSIVRLSDVASIKDQFSETPNAFYFNGNLSVNVSVTSTNSEDLLTSAETIKEYITEFNKINNNVQLDVVRDLSITLNQRTALLTENAIIGMLLVLLFLSIFLNTRLAFWVAFGLPVAFLGMFIFAAQFDVTINVLSLFGMIIVIGILVDDGIVIAENIYQHFEMGKSPIRAAIDGTMEVIPPIISAVLTTILAFSTFLFLDGRIGEFFGEVSTIVILTLVVSLVEALIILPAHLAHSKALRTKKEIEATKSTGLFAKMRNINKWGDKIMQWLNDKVYSPLLRFTLKFKVLVFAIFTALFIITIGAVKGGIIGTTLFPSIASDRISVSLSMPNGTNEKITDSIITIIESKANILNKELTKEYLVGEEYEGKVIFENVLKRLSSSSEASLNINLLPGEERPDAVNASLVANKLRELVGPVYGTESLIFGSGGNFGGSPVAVSLLSNTIGDLKGAKVALKEWLNNNPLLKDVSDNDPAGIKEIRLKLKENAYLIGLDLRTIMTQVRAGFFGTEAQRFQRGQDEIRVWVRYDRNERSSIDNLDQMRILTPDGNRVPLEEIATYTIERGDVAINHLKGIREIQVSADLKDPSQSATDILDAIRNEVMPEIQAKFPSVTASFEGQNREASKISNSAGLVFPIILALIYMTIAFTFRSYSQPLLLMLLIPFSFTAVAWGHLIHGFPVNILSALGIIALIGIMVNDGLVLIGKFNSNIQKGLQFDEALYEAGRSRFRAIFLTSLTTIAGLAPLIFEKSRQAQFLKPMAISIAYGIGYATVLTLLVLPLFLAFSNKFKVLVKWLITGNDVTKEEVERAFKEVKNETNNEEELLNLESSISLTKLKNDTNEK